MKVEEKRASLLQIWREGLCLTKKDLSEKLKMSQSLYGKYEMSLNIPRTDVALRIVDFFIRKKIDGANIDSFARDIIKRHKKIIKKQKRK